MARIVIGTQPKVEARGYTHTVGQYLLALSDAHLTLAYIKDRARREGVPPEAELTRETDDEALTETFTWRWWEITL